MKKRRERKVVSSVLIALLILFSGCEEEIKKEIPVVAPVVHQKLPYFGEHDVELVRNDQGSSIPDTVYYRIPKFSFTNQDNADVSHKNYDGKVFVADFFFTTCKSICPVMSSQMARLQTLIQKENLQNEVMFLSHSVKPLEDTPEVLKNYGNSLGADFSNWNFVTGKPDDIYDQAQQGYMLSAFPSDTADGGVFHTDKFTLIDREMHIRGYYDGTSTKEVNQLFEDLKLLVKEK
jgi:protein SCO1